MTLLLKWYSSNWYSDNAGGLHSSIFTAKDKHATVKSFHAQVLSSYVQFKQKGVNFFDVEEEHQKFEVCKR